MVGGGSRGALRARLSVGGACETVAVSQPRRVAILGGGIAGLSAAWELSRADQGEPGARVTVYQRGWRLGGKGASSRGIHGRIEEHGLHVWLGYYENAFRLVRECYAELDRPRNLPHAPITRWDEAFRPASTIGLGAHRDPYRPRCS